MSRQSSKIVLTGALLTHSNTDYFTSYLTDAHAKLKKPIWLTEFMGRGTLEEQKKFLEFAVPWLEKQDFIERYAVFGAYDGATRKTRNETLQRPADGSMRQAHLTTATSGPTSSTRTGA